MKPADLLDILANYSIMTLIPNQKYGIPGEIISNLSKEQRETIQDLKSDDLNKLRSDALPEYLMCNNEAHARKVGLLYDYRGRLVVRLNLK